MFPSVKCHSTEALARLDLAMLAQHHLGATLHTLFWIFLPDWIALWFWFPDTPGQGFTPLLVLAHLDKEIACPYPRKPLLVETGTKNGGL